MAAKSRVNHRRKAIVILLVLTAILYVGGYVHARRQHLLVHRSAYAYGKTDSHSVDEGDFGPGLLSGNAGQLSLGAWVVFTPLRWTETLYWYVRHPRGQRWPYGMSQ
ncbi:MAG: hypothetical protein NTW19_18030 [Planctomycetota bacterium]|nr:hypothetical protein [Planctomycetota bacterium]